MTTNPDIGVSPRYTKTERLVLRPVCAQDVELVYSLNSNPKLWDHLPSGIHTSSDQTISQISSVMKDWADHNLGYWIATLHDDSFVGVGGCAVRGGVAWNIYFRLLPEQQGKGLATEIARAGLIAAKATRPELPVTATLLEHNFASKAVAEKLGLTLVWRGVDAANPDQTKVRLIYADRQLSQQTLDILAAI